MLPSSASTQLNFNFNSIEAEIVLFSTFKGHPPTTHPPTDHQTGEVVISAVTDSILFKI